TPSVKGQINGVLTINSNDPDESSLNISLSGEGITSPDNDPPAKLPKFTATPGDGQVELSWKNPDDSDFLGTLIVYRNDRYPTRYNDGTVVCDRTNSPGSEDTFFHSGLQNGNQYYYAAFAYDINGNYSEPAYDMATPNGGVSKPDISLSETSHNYGPVEIASYSDWTLVIENKGNDNLIINDIYSDNTDFSIISPASFPKNLSPGQSLEVEVRFSPSTEGEISGGLTINSNDPDESTIIVFLLGEGRKNSPLPDSGTITLKNGKDGYSGNSMRLLFSRYPNTNYGRTLWAGRIGEYAGINRLVIRFDDLVDALYQIPADATIVSAKLRLYQYRYENYDAGGQTINLFALKTAFDPDTVCWNSPWFEPGTGEDDIEPNPLSSVTLDDKVNVWREWDVTSYVKEVYNGQRENLGFLLKASDESRQGLHSRYKMDNDPDQGLRPELVIEYSSSSNHDPIISEFTAEPTSGYAPLDVQFSASASDEDGDLLTYTLDFGDGTEPATGEGGEISISHTYYSEGNFTAILTVEDAHNASVTERLTISVGEDPSIGTITLKNGKDGYSGNSMR
ncbi:MAG: DNRLRE domain-containing protein, partial [Candidatus Desulfofervidus sp.]|nr:DNRLRE domain-containing protein [Candidatus Desulfofervidus sp.]